MPFFKLENLGKISITCEGKWFNRKYDKLCLVYDDGFNSYISKRPVPMNIALDNENFWQPISKFDKTLLAGFDKFKKDVIDLLTKVQAKLNSSTRLVVETNDDRYNLTSDEIGVGCEVYVIETGLAWILDSIDDDNNKTWHCEYDDLKNSIDEYLDKAFTEYTTTVNNSLTSMNNTITNISSTYDTIAENYKKIVETLNNLDTDSGIEFIEITE